MLLNKKKLKSIIIRDDKNISDVIENLNKSGLKIALIIDKNNLFRGIIEDGDIRRAILLGYKKNSSINKIINTRPFVVSDFLYSTQDINSNLINYRNIPVIRNKKLIGLYVGNLDVKNKKIYENIVIMAGGYGKRLGGLTKSCPKILLKYKNQTILEHIIHMLKKNNCININLSVFYLKKLIKNFIKKNNSFGLNIKFLEEKKPLGTIGSIGNLKNVSKNFIVMNCDQLSDLDLNKLLHFHIKNKSLLTICTKTLQHVNPYGVISSYKSIFKNFEEKPITYYNINAGIYVFNKQLIHIIKKNKLKNFDNLIDFLKKKYKKTFVYNIKDSWLDLSLEKENLSNPF